MVLFLCDGSNVLARRAGYSAHAALKLVLYVITDHTTASRLLSSTVVSNIAPLSTNNSCSSFWHEPAQNRGPMTWNRKNTSSCDKELGSLVLGQGNFLSQRNCIKIYFSSMTVWEKYIHLFCIKGGRVPNKTICIFFFHWAIKSHSNKVFFSHLN